MRFTSGLKKTVLAGAAIGVAVAVASATQAVAAPAGSGPVPGAGAETPAAGVGNYNTNVCGTNWVDVHIPNNSYYNFYNAPEGQATTCMTVMRYHLDFQITHATIHRGWGFPNISSGWAWGRYTCTGHSGACFKYPVQQRYDGTPRTSVATWLAPGRYNAAYDIWFNRTDGHPGQDNGTEVMIWLAHPGISVWSVSRYVTIDGIRWAVMTWTAHHNGAYWHYVAYVAVHQRSSVYGLWLNPFFREAIAHGELRNTWWLTAIDFGFELVAGGVHDNVHYYKLTGLPTTR